MHNGISVDGIHFAYTFVAMSDKPLASNLQGKFCFKSVHKVSEHVYSRIILVFWTTEQPVYLIHFEQSFSFKTEKPARGWYNMHTLKYTRKQIHLKESWSFTCTEFVYLTLRNSSDCPENHLPERPTVNYNDNVDLVTLKKSCQMLVLPVPACWSCGPLVSWTLRKLFQKAH